MNEKDKQKTAFANHKGLFEFTVMLFGIWSVPVVFQELISVVLHNCLYFAYLDA